MAPPDALFANGSLGNADLTVLTNENLCRIQIVPGATGAFTGVALNVQGSLNGTDFAPISFIDDGLYARDVDATLSGLSAGKTLELNCAMFRVIRVAVTAVASGSVKVVMRSTKVGLVTQLGGG